MVKKKCGENEYDDEYQECDNEKIYQKVGSRCINNTQCKSGTCKKKADYSRFNSCH